jgi:hypothetical protein
MVLGLQRIDDGLGVHLINMMLMGMGGRAENSMFEQRKIRCGNARNAIRR